MAYRMAYPEEDERMSDELAAGLARLKAQFAANVAGYPLPEGSPVRSLVIGRATDCDWVVADEFASLHHAILSQYPDGSVWVEDSGTRNGTWLNGLRIVAPMRVRSGDGIRVGRTNLTVP